VFVWKWRRLVRSLLAATLQRRRLLVRGPVNSGLVCLTFDDGPDPVHTGGLLDVLKEEGVPATFFVIGQQAERHPELVRRMAAEGHVVGHHSYCHSDPQRTSARELLDEVERTRRVLAALLGKAPDLFRPPHGKVTVSKLWKLWRAGQTVVLWNVDTKDYACTSAAELKERLEASPLRSGDVVLMHDNRPYAAQVVRDLIAVTRARGLGFATVLPWTA